MKFVLFALCCSFPSLSLAQKAVIEYSYVTTAGELAASSGHQLTMFQADLNAISQSGRGSFEVGNVGHVTFTTPRFVTGGTETGGTFDAGGSFFIAMDATIEPGVQFNGKFVNGCWTRDFLADGTSNYILTAHIKGTLILQDGISHTAFGLATLYSLNQGKGEFVGTQSSGGGSIQVTVAQ